MHKEHLALEKDIKTSLSLVPFEGPASLYDDCGFNQWNQHSFDCGYTIHKCILNEVTIIRNRYLREDLNKGQFDIGILMNIVKQGGVKERAKQTGSIQEPAACLIDGPEGH